MIRRQFLKLATLTSATGLASLGALDALEKHHQPTALDAAILATVNWHVRGFTCVTCAVGLETMLRQQKGVASVHASYPGASVTIQFRPDQISEASLQSFISELGFTAETLKG
jgi:Cu+-exporting ATPase